MHVLKNNFAGVWKIENYSNRYDLRLHNYEKTYSTYLSIKCRTWAKEILRLKN